MARRIDLAFGFAVLLAAGFMLFWRATGWVASALMLTAVLALLIRACYRAWQTRFGRALGVQRKRVDDARALVAHWAVEPDERAAEAHVRARYKADADYRFVLLARHPAARALDANDLIELWRAHKGEARLVAASTGPVELSAQASADTLTAPCVRLLDADALTDAVRLSGIDIPPAPAKARKLRLPGVMPSKKRAPMLIVYALFMLAAYWFLGALMYLIAALGLLALAALSLKRRKPPDLLFHP